MVYIILGNLYEHFWRQKCWISGTAWCKEICTKEKEYKVGISYIRHQILHHLLFLSWHIPRLHLSPCNLLQNLKSGVKFLSVRFVDNQNLYVCMHVYFDIFPCARHMYAWWGTLITLNNSSHTITEKCWKQYVDQLFLITSISFSFLYIESLP